MAYVGMNLEDLFVNIGRSGNIGLINLYSDILKTFVNVGMVISDLTKPIIDGNRY